MDHEQPLSAYDRVVVYVNPRSTNAKRAQRAAEELQASHYGSRVELTPAYEAPADAQAAFVDNLDETSIAVVMGGDGTVSHTVDRMLHTDGVRGGRIPVLAAGAGNGNDIAHTYLGGRVMRQPLARILDRADITPIYPITTTMHDTFEQRPDEIRHAVAYVGIGVTAVGARLFDAVEHRESPLYNFAPVRMLKELQLSGRVLTSTRGEHVFTPENDRLLSFAELTVANQSRMARYARWPVEATDPVLFVGGVEKTNLPSIAGWLGRLTSGHVPGMQAIWGPKGSYIGNSDEFTQAVQFVTATPGTPIHWDAEHGTLPRGTAVDIRRSDTPFYAVTTKL